ncbi:MAG: penicillin-binding protein 2 [Demequinaceae bacterium]|nr:penicillin-binding protein 2 [Demequinaceae bacterium]
MNASIRRLATLAFVMFLVLMFAATWIQFIQADSLNSDSRNRRTLYREFGTFRGPIIVDGEAIVYSVPVNDYFSYQRTYVDGPLYAPVTGFYSVVYGRTGIEQAENSLLNGSSDSLFWSRLGDLLSGQDQQGASIELTLRSSLQRVAFEALGDQSGAVIALDPRTGEILAMVSRPSYDPSVLADHTTSAVVDAYEALESDPGQPLINRVIAGDTYPPGSLFKLVTVSAALEAGLTPDSIVFAPAELDLPLTDLTIENYGGYACDVTDSTTLAQALKKSCNTPFADLALSLGWQPIADKAQDFGWGEELSIPLPVTPSRLPDEPNEPEGAMSAIGQFDVRATPLQMAMIGSAIANDGVLMRPYLVTRVRDSSLRVLSTAQPSILAIPLYVEDSGYLRDMMVEVVESGTGTAAQISGVAVAGKTGTAETGDGSAPHAWFLGFAPAEDPVVVVVVLVERGGDLGDEATGGRLSAPIAREVIIEALRLEEERVNQGLG